MKTILAFIESVYDQLEPRKKSRMLVKPDKWHIADLSFTGNYHLSHDFLRKMLELWRNKIFTKNFTVGRWM